MYYLYWIHLPFHTDPFTEGYVGITNDFERRKDEHLRKSMRFPPGSVMRVLTQCEDFETAQCVEFFLRPKWYVGWNVAIGGQDGNRPFGINTSGWTHSEESKKKRSLISKGNKSKSTETIYDGIVFSQQKLAAKYISKKYDVPFGRARKYLLGVWTFEQMKTDQRKHNGNISHFPWYKTQKKGVH